MENFPWFGDREGRQENRGQKIRPEASRMGMGGEKRGQLGDCLGKKSYDGKETSWGGSVELFQPVHAGE